MVVSDKLLKFKFTILKPTWKLGKLILPKKIVEMIVNPVRARRASDAGTVSVEYDGKFYPLSSENFDKVLEKIIKGESPEDIVPPENGGVEPPEPGQEDGGTQQPPQEEDNQEDQAQTEEYMNLLATLLEPIGEDYSITDFGGSQVPGRDICNINLNQKSISGTVKHMTKFGPFEGNTNDGYFLVFKQVQDYVATPIKNVHIKVKNEGKYYTYGDLVDKPGAHTVMVYLGNDADQISTKIVELSCEVKKSDYTGHNPVVRYYTLKNLRAE